MAGGRRDVKSGGERRFGDAGPAQGTGAALIAATLFGRIWEK